MPATFKRCNCWGQVFKHRPVEGFVNLKLGSMRLLSKKATQGWYLIIQFSLYCCCPLLEDLCTPSVPKRMSRIC
jgi:hypothetical protein